MLLRSIAWYSEGKERKGREEEKVDGKGEGAGFPHVIFYSLTTGYMYVTFEYYFAWWFVLNLSTVDPMSSSIAELAQRGTLRIRFSIEKADLILSSNRYYIFGAQYFQNKW